MKYCISKKDFQKFENYFTMQVIKEPTYRYGQAFLNYFHPYAEAYLRETSNLGTPAGVWHTPDDELLWEIKSASKAEHFIRERIEIV